MSDVTAQHADYNKYRALWDKVEDAVAGEDAIKARKEKYLPRPNPTKIDDEHQRRYDQYIQRAVYYNATGRTLRALVGLAFGVDPKLTLPAKLEFARNDVDGASKPLYQQAQAALAEALKTGRCGLFVDFPDTTGAPTTQAQESAGERRPTAALYHATDIINWRTQRVGGRTLLALVVLAEKYEEVALDGFATTVKDQYRVLRMADGVFTVDIWRQVAQNTLPGLAWQLFQSFTPLRGDGARWTEIPFQFIGSEDNNWEVDDAPLYDIAGLNIGHYRNSADYEESVFIAGQPTYWISGLSEEWRTWYKDNQVQIGSRNILAVPVQGTAGILQAAPNTLAKEAMSQKEEQMATLGARLIQPTQVTRTATQTRSDDAAAHSTLSLACRNVSAGYSQILVWFATYANVPLAEGEALFEINTDFLADQIDAQMMLALFQMVQGGKLPETDFWTQLRRVGLIKADKTNDEIREEIDSQSPGPGLDLGLSRPNGAAEPAAATDSKTDPAGARRPGLPAPFARRAEGGGGGDAPARGNGSTPSPSPEPLDLATVKDWFMAGFQALADKLAQVIGTKPAANGGGGDMPISVTINVPPNAVVVNSPVTVEAPPAATVNVAAPTVNVEAPPPANVTVNVPPPEPMDIIPERGKDGRVSYIKQVPSSKGGGT